MILRREAEIGSSESERFIYKIYDINAAKTMTLWGKVEYTDPVTKETKLSDEVTLSDIPMNVRYIHVTKQSKTTMFSSEVKVLVGIGRCDAFKAKTVLLNYLKANDDIDLLRVKEILENNQKYVFNPKLQKMVYEHDPIPNTERFERDEDEVLCRAALRKVNLVGKISVPLTSILKDKKVVGSAIPESTVLQELIEA
jgi:hypothetical protein